MGEFSIFQILIVAIVTFIMAIDQFSLTELLYRPIINCTIIGAVLGDMTIGMAIGGTYELMMIGNMPVGGAQPPNAVLGGIVAVVFAIGSGFDTLAAIGAAIPFALFGQYAVTLTFTIMSGLMAKADKAAEDADPKAITNVNIISMLILGALFTAMSVVALTAGPTLGKVLETFAADYSWIMGGLGVAGGMMRYVGFAILMKIMLSNDLWGFFLAGFAAATIIAKVPDLGGVTLLLVAFIGLAIAIYDFQTNVSMKNAGGNGNGGVSDGI
ncbi:MAG: PTS sugar transporter subunit IIC [Erysipelotrichaceae bacterium]